eukprot:GFYU01015085.1.p1 GENE.GFYU01015085.1~~GFYU01015085.1.p1  ORF type:complete len:519 (-),score=108.58 GFYU01015085.1:45-1601(-)
MTDNEDGPSEATFEDLPEDVVCALIFSRLDHNYLTTVCRLVCKHWKELVYWVGDVRLRVSSMSKLTQWASMGHIEPGALKIIDFTARVQIERLQVAKEWAAMCDLIREQMKNLEKVNMTIYLAEYSFLVVNHLLEAIIANKDLPLNINLLASMSDEMIKPDTWELYATILSSVRTVTRFVYHRKHMRAAGIQRFLEAFKPNTWVHDLTLSSNKASKEGSRMIADMLKTNKTIRRIHLADNWIEATSCGYFGEALKVNTTLEYLGLEWNDIRDLGMVPLADGLRNNTTITTLNLKDNKMQVEGAQTLCELLKENQTITCVDLADNKYGPEVGATFGEMLRVNSGLTHLDIAYNDLGDNGLSALAAGLAANGSLVSFVSAHNSITRSYSELCAELLKCNNSTLTHLDFASNNVGSLGAQATAELLRNTQVLNNLDLGDNYIKKEDFQAVIQAMTVNQSMGTLWIRPMHVQDDDAEMVVDMFHKRKGMLEFISMPSTTIPRAAKKLLVETASETGVDLRFN